MKIFISYAREYRDTVRQLDNLLDKNGYDAWFDEDIDGGEDWWRSIIKSIQHCDIFVFALSPEATASDACRAEYDYALTLNKPILPIMLKSAELPRGRLAETHYVDGQNLQSIDTITTINRAIVRLQERIHRGEFPLPNPLPPDPVFPFPPDDLQEVRDQLAQLNRLSEDELIGVIARISKIAASNRRTVNEARRLLEQIAANQRLPAYVVQMARTALIAQTGEQPALTRRRRRGLLVIGLGLMLVGAVAIVFLFNPPPAPAPTPTTAIAVVVTEPAEATPTSTVTATLMPTGEPQAVVTAEITLTHTSSIEATIEVTAEPTTEVTAGSFSTAALFEPITAESAAQIEQLRVLRADPDQTSITLGHRDEIRGVIFDSSGQHLVSGSNDTALHIWSMPSGVWEGGALLGGQITGIAIAPDSPIAASTDFNGRLHVIDLPSGNVINQIRAPAPLYVPAFIDSTSGLVGGSDNTLYRWQVGTTSFDGEFPHLTEPFNRRIRMLTISPDGQLAASSNTESATDTSSAVTDIRLWDLTTGELRFRLTGHTRAATDLAFSPDGSRLASVSWDRTLRVWDVSTGDELFTATNNTFGANVVAYSPDGTRIAVGYLGGEVIVWDAAGALVWRAVEHAGDIQAVAFSRDSSAVISLSSSSLTIWRSSDGSVRRVINASGGAVTSFAVNTAGTLLAIGSTDGAIALWGLPAVGQCIGSFIFGTPTNIRSAPVVNSDNIVSLLPVNDQLIFTAQYTDTDRQWLQTSDGYWIAANTLRVTDSAPCSNLPIGYSG